MTHWTKYGKAYTQSPKGKQTRRRYLQTYRLDPDNHQRINNNNTRNKRQHLFRVRAYHFNWRFASTLTAQQLASLWHKQKGKCALTGERLTRYNAHLDHVIPRSRGGETVISNLRWLHETVNHAKWNFTDAEFIAFCRKVVAYVAG